MIPNRPDDALGIGVIYTGISNRVHAFDLDSGLPVARTFEMLFEMCYTMQLKPVGRCSPISNTSCILAAMW
jgi:hypothetical protein